MIRREPSPVGGSDGRDGEGMDQQITGNKLSGIRHSGQSESQRDKRRSGCQRANGTKHWKYISESLERK